MEKDLIENIDRVHTTEKGLDRIKNNIGMSEIDVVSWCKEKILNKNAFTERKGKNWYVHVDGCVITVNANSYTIITCHREKECVDTRGSFSEENYKPYIIEATDFCRKNIDSFISLIHRIDSLHEEFDKSRRFFQTDEVYNTIYEYLFFGSMEEINNKAFYFFRDVLIDIYNNSNKVKRLRNFNETKSNPTTILGKAICLFTGQTNTECEYREKAFLVHKELYLLLRCFIDIDKKSWGNDRIIVGNIIKWLYAQFWISRRKLITKVNQNNFEYVFIPLFEEMEEAFELTESFLENGRTVREAPSVIRSKYKEKIDKEKAILKELKRPVDTNMKYSGVVNFNYSNICWSCHKPISSEYNRRCPICGWFVCSCGKCAPDCSQKQNASLNNDIYIENVNKKIDDLNKRCEAEIEEIRRTKYTDKPIRTEYDYCRPKHILDPRFEEVFHTGASETSLDVLFEIMDPIFASV